MDFSQGEPGEWIAWFSVPLAGVAIICVAQWAYIKWADGQGKDRGAFARRNVAVANVLLLIGVGFGILRILAEVLS